MSDPREGSSRASACSGTVGWIVAGLLISALSAEALALQFRMAAWRLAGARPVRVHAAAHAAGQAGARGDAARHPRPRRAAADEEPIVRGLRPRVVSGLHPAAVLLRLHEPVPRTSSAGRAPTAMQSLGQVSEVGFMLVMPIFFVRLGVKNMLLVGMAAWMARYRALRVRRQPRDGLDAATSASCCTASATTSSSSPGRSTSTARRRCTSARRRRASSRSSPTASACSSARTLSGWVVDQYVTARRP